MNLLNEVPITLLVKAPNQKVADQTVECALSWTVWKLKEHLARVYPSNPTESQQRLIYSGKLLQDDVVLRDILKQGDESESIHTLHLVCSNLSTDASTSQNALNSNPSHVSAATEGLRQRHIPTSMTRLEPQDAVYQQQPTADLTTPVSANNVTDRLQFPPSAFNPAHYNSFVSPYVPPTVATSSYTAEQLRWLQLQQQAYIQYMTNYMQFFQQGAVAMGQPFDPLVPPVVTQAAIPANQNAAQDQPVNAALGQIVQPQQPQVIRMNAQGGPVNDDDEDEFDRDWLDWFYVGVRFALLMCILYFYSTPTRFFVTLLLMLFIYIFQIGWFRVIGRQRQEAPHVNPPEGNADGQPNANAETDQGASAPQEQRPPGGLALAWSVFLAFFASLAPQAPPPVNAN